MEATEPKLEVISLVYNRARDAEDLLNSLVAQTKRPDRVWLIDNGSEIPLAIEPSQWPFPVHIHRLDPNIGIAGYNEGFKKAESKFVVIVDSDVTLRPDTLEIFAKAFQNSPDLIFAGAKILDATTKKPMFDNPIHGAKVLPGGGNYMVQFNGSCFGANRDAFLELGGFDQRLFLYVNEWDLTLRAFSKFRPEQIRYFAEAVAFHKTSPSTDRSRLYQQLIRRNEFWVRWKYYPVADAVSYSVRFVGGSMRKFLFENKNSKDRELQLQYLREGVSGLNWVLRERAPLQRKIFERLIQMRNQSQGDDNLAPSF